MTDQSKTAVTRAMLEAAHRAELEHFMRNFPQGTSLATTPYPVLKSIIQAALKAQLEENRDDR